MVISRHLCLSLCLWLGPCLFWLGLPLSSAHSSWNISRIDHDPSFPLYVSSGTSPKQLYRSETSFQGPSLRFEYQDQPLELLSAPPPLSSCSSSFRSIRVSYGKQSWHFLYKRDQRADLQLRFFPNRPPSIFSPQGFLLKTDKPMLCPKDLWKDPRSLSSPLFPAGHALGQAFFLCRLRSPHLSPLYGIWDGRECKTLSSEPRSSSSLEVLTASPLHVSWIIPSPFALDEPSSFLRSLSSFCRFWNENGVFPGLLRDKKCVSPLFPQPASSFDILTLSASSHLLSGNDSPPPHFPQEIRYVYHKNPDPPPRSRTDRLGGLSLSFFQEKQTLESADISITINDRQSRNYTQNISMKFSTKPTFALASFSMKLRSLRTGAKTIDGFFETSVFRLRSSSHEKRIPFRSNVLPSFFRWEILASRAPFQPGASILFRLFDFSSLSPHRLLLTYAGLDTLLVHGKTIQAHRFHSPDGREACWLSPQRQLLRVRLDGGQRYLSWSPLYYRGLEALQRP